MSLNLNTAMDALGARLLTITGLRVYDFTADAVAVPAAVVGLPEVTYDHTKARGADHVLFPVHILVSKISDRASRDKLSTYLAGSGAASVKTAIDGTLGGVVKHAQVVGSSPKVIQVGGVDYSAYTFEVEVLQ